MAGGDLTLAYRHNPFRYPVAAQLQFGTGHDRNLGNARQFDFD